MMEDNFIEKKSYIPSNAYDLVFGKNECNTCGGSGEIQIPGSGKTCPCCFIKDKIKDCKECNGRGIT